MSKLTSGEINAQGYGIAPVVSSPNYDYRGIPKNQSTDNNKTTTQSNSGGMANTGLGIKPTVTNPGYDSRGIPIAYSPDNKKTVDDGAPPPGGYTGGGGGGSSGDSAPSVDTGENTGTDYTQAADTVSRITKGLDMSEKIAAADQAWADAMGQYGGQAQNLLDQYKNQTTGNLGEYQTNAQNIINQLSGLTQQELADYAARTGQTIDQATKQINDILAGLQDSLKPVEAGRVGRVDTIEKEDLLKQIVDAQKEQSQRSIDYTVQQGVNELQRAQEDAQGQFQTQRNQIAANEKNALDNQALYSEMRGDRGGIGQAQYSAIQNNAATNQLTVNKEQTKLATDTARQIADLRAQGEFKKADALLEITQEYLGKLMQLKQWADEMNVSIDEFNIGVEEWEQEYNAKIQQSLGELSIAATQYMTGLNLDKDKYLNQQRLSAAQQDASLNLGVEKDVQSQRQALNDALAQYGLNNAQYMTNSDINRLTTALNAYMQNAQNMASTELSAANVFGAASDKTPTMAAAEADRTRLANVAGQMIAAGVSPTDDQLKALGWTKDQYKAYKSAMDAAASAVASGGGYSRDDAYKIVSDMITGNKTVSSIETTLNALDAGGQARNVQKARDLLSTAVNEKNYGKNGTGYRE